MPTCYTARRLRNSSTAAALMASIARIKTHYTLLAAPLTVDTLNTQQTEKQQVRGREKEVFELACLSVKPLPPFFSPCCRAALLFLSSPSHNRSIGHSSCFPQRPFSPAVRLKTLISFICNHPFQEFPQPSLALLCKI